MGGRALKSSRSMKSPSIFLSNKVTNTVVVAVKARSCKPLSGLKRNGAENTCKISPPTVAANDKISPPTVEADNLRSFCFGGYCSPWACPAFCNESMMMQRMIAQRSKNFIIRSRIATPLIGITPEKLSQPRSLPWRPPRHAVPQARDFFHHEATKRTKEIFVFFVSRAAGCSFGCGQRRVTNSTRICSKRLHHLVDQSCNLMTLALT